MKITFLGTGTSGGVPLIACQCNVCTSENPKDKRLRCSILIENQGNVMVIDSGPDFRQQMLRAQVKNLDGLIFTHEHKDHIAGMDDVRAFNFIHNKEVDIYASELVQHALKREFHYIFNNENYPGIPKIKIHTISNAPFKIKETEFLPVEVLHFKLPVFGFRIKDFCYITDAKTISEKEKAKLKGLKVLVLNALRREEHVAHFTFEEAIALAMEINAETTYLTHISHQLGRHTEIDMELPKNIRLAYDGLELFFD